jgi:hypothetical protein
MTEFIEALANAMWKPTSKQALHLASAVSTKVM